jgi:prepilin-type N-terminal cleavage/methylation domain-containing protein
MSNRAFTLVELLVTLGIIVILAGISFISIINYKQRQELVSASQEIVSVLRNAQDRSISQESGSRWGVYFENPSSGTDFFDLFRGETYAGGELVSRAALSSNLQFVNPVSGSNVTIIFSPITGLPNSSTTIKLSLISNSTVSSTIIIDTNGKIQY